MSLVTPDDLGVYLGITLSVDEVARAQMLIDDAIVEALAVVTVGTIPDSGATEANLPAGAASVIRSSVARVFLNPAAVTSETAGPFAYTRPAVSGAMLSPKERRKLRLLKGGGSAFTIDMLPAPDDLGVLPPWDSGNDIALIDLP